MKSQILTVCLLATLAGAGRAQSAPVVTSPVFPPVSPAAPLGPDLEARSQTLEARRDALEAEFQQLAAEVEAQAQRSDPQGRLTSDQIYRLLEAREQRLAGERVEPGPILVCHGFGLPPHPVQSRDCPALVPGGPSDVRGLLRAPHSHMRQSSPRWVV